MARRAAGEDVVPPNVISLAQARTARRALFHWPADGPHAERVAVAALHAIAGEAALVAADGTILAVNRPWLLTTPTAGPGTDVFTSWRLHELDPRDAAQLITGLRSALGGTDGYTHDLHVDGRPLRMAATSLGGNVGGAVLSVIERDPRAAVPAGRDPLTGLADRARFADHLDRARRAADGRAVAVLLIDLFELELVGQAHGHAVGEQLLVEAGRRISTAAADDDVVARLGAGQLAVLTGGRVGGDAADPLARALAVAEQLAEPVPVGDRRLHLDATVGVRLVASGEPGTAEAILGDAAVAVQEARRSRVGIAVYDGGTRARLLHRRARERDDRATELLAPPAPATTSQITHRRADQPSMETQEGHRHE